MARTMPYMSTKDSLVNQAVADALRMLKVQTKSTYEDLMAASGLPKSGVRRMLHGETDISMANMTAMAGAMGKTPEELMERVFREIDYDDAFHDAVQRISGAA